MPGRFLFLLVVAGFELGLGVGFKFGCGSWMNPLTDEQRPSGDNILDFNLWKLQEIRIEKLKNIVWAWYRVMKIYKNTKPPKNKKVLEYIFDDMWLQF